MKASNSGELRETTGQESIPKLFYYWYRYWFRNLWLILSSKDFDTSVM